MGKWSQSSWLLSIKPLWNKSNLAFILSRWRCHKILADFTRLRCRKSCLWLFWKHITFVLTNQPWLQSNIASLLANITRHGVADFTTVLTYFSQLLTDVSRYGISCFSKLLANITIIQPNFTLICFAAVQPDFTTL